LSVICPVMVCCDGVFVARRWYKSCQDEDHQWMCTSVEDYIRHSVRGCPYIPGSHGNQPMPVETNPPPPAGQCLLVAGRCQFTDSPLQCVNVQNSSDLCRYHCVAANSSFPDMNVSGSCDIGSRFPPPDQLCLPMNGLCQPYSPCRYWKGHCSAPYQCGTVDDFYRFRMGPQPACAPPPPGFESPRPPGQCILQNDSCSWSGKCD